MPDGPRCDHLLKPPPLESVRALDLDDAVL